MKNDKDDNIQVYPNSKLEFAGKEYRCAIGKNGATKNKVEGDGKSPIGCWPIREVFYREDKIEKPQSIFKITVISKDDGWCDDADDKENYNKHIKLPYSGSDEKLWREDNIYDIIVVLGYNDDPAIPGKGSAIFMHVARENYSGTEGCVALAKNDLLEILKKAQPQTRVCIKN